MSPSATPPRGILRPPPLVAAIAFAKLSLLLSCASAYGYVAGELVSLACARHLAWGYAAHPPLSIAFLLGVVKLYGESEVTVRVIPAILSVVVVVLTARLAKRFGAGTLAQGLAALCVVLAPGLLSIDHIYSTRSIEVLFSIVIAGLVARALAASAEEGTAAWLSVGAAIGLGLENDLTLLVYVGGLAAGLAVAHGRRKGEPWLGWRGPAAALGVAAVLIAPYVAWESTHAWPTRDLFLGALHAGRAAAHPLRFALRQFEVMLPPSAILWVAGLWALLRGKRFATYRPLGVAFVVAFVVWALVSDGESGHVAAMFPVLFAAGAAALDPWLDARRWAYGAFAGIVFVVGMVAVPLTLPVLPVAKYEAYAERLHLGPSLAARELVEALPPRFAGMFGWPELVRAVDTVVASLPPEEREEAVILASDAGQAGAIDLFGPALNLPPVISGDGEFWRWGTTGASGKVVVAVGGDEAFLRAHFRAVDLVTVFGHSLAAPSRRHVRIYLCRDSIAPLDVMWPDFRGTG